MIESVVISSGHGLHVRGASGVLDEVDEARRVTERVANELEALGIGVAVFHDDQSKSQDENLRRIVDHHNAQGAHDLDISIHFNAYQPTAKPMGTEVLFVTQQQLAGNVSAAIASAGALINRGPKPRDDLYFLNNTDEPAILIEVCFVDSEADAELYDERFSEICRAIAHAISGEELPEEELPPPAVEVAVTGKCSHFGGPGDTTGVTADEGLAFIYKVEDAPHLFLPSQPAGSTGLARRLNPYVHYLAMRWDYSKYPKAELVNMCAWVRNPRTGFGLMAIPADWGPNEATGRIADLSPGLMAALELETDDVVEVIFPWDGEMLA